MHKVLREQNNLSIFKFDNDLFHIDFYKVAEVLDVRNNEYNNECGAYLFIDKICNQIICAGCTWTSFAQRHKEHTKGSKLDTEKSQESFLYCSYSHHYVQVDGFLRALQRGSWSDLQMVTHVRWAKGDRKNVVGLFVWDQNVLGGLNRNRMSAQLLDKQERMVSYLFETVLGLCIAGLNNISSNPSFESFNGSFAG